MFKQKKADSATVINPLKRFLIAIVIIVVGFGLLAAMLYIQHTIAASTIQSLIGMVQSNLTDATLSESAKIYEDINKTNQTVFNILLPVISALMGTVVAFYFGSENLAKAQETLEKAMISPEEKLSQSTIADLMKNQPKTKDVKTIAMKDDVTIEKAKKAMDDITNVLVITPDGKPLGILYIWEIEKLENLGAKGDDKLAEKIGLIDKDFITKSPWSKAGVKNFAVLSTGDTLLDAKKRMDAIAQSLNNRLSVRGIVLDEQEKVMGIINFANISAELL